MNSSPSLVRPHRLSRRSFLRGLAAVPVCLPLVRNYAAESSARPLPATGPRGRVIRVDDEVKELRDAETGARVMRLTGDGSDNVHLYFTSESFVDGSNTIVFGSNRTGRYQHYRLDLRERKLTQLTDGESIRPTMACLAQGGHLIYFDGPLLRSLKLETLEDRELYRVPDGWEPHLPTCTANGDFVAFSYREKLAVSTQTNVIYSSMAETFYQHPTCVIMRIDTRNGKPVAVWGERNWISHVPIHPTDSNRIVFCHEGGSYTRQRMFVVNAGDRIGRVPQPLYRQVAGEYCVHEYFTREGEVGFQYEVERDGKTEHYNACIRPDGTWVRQYLLPGPRPGHIQSNSANTLIIGDRGFLSPDDKTGGAYMSLMTHANGRAQVRRLCRHQPGPTQYSHGHPVFSLDDQWVLFNSRLGTKENIMMADVGSLGRA